MAGESPQKKQVPKVFTEKAKMAAMEAQARMDLMKAQSDAAFNVNKAKQKAMATRAQFMGSQMDAQRQAAADREAAGPQEPVGMEDWSPTPMPDPRAPSSSLMGATGPDISSILTPQSVQGGAGIQAATGGMGRAEPGGGVNPAQLQGQVNPYNVTQSTVNRTVPVQMGGGVLNVPQTATETTITPNQLSPYELGQLQTKLAIAGQKSQDAVIKDTLDEATTNLAKAQRLFGTQMMATDDYLNVIGATAATIGRLGLPKELMGVVQARAAGMQGTLQNEDFKSWPEIQKELALVKTMKPGTLDHGMTMKRIAKLAEKDVSELGPLVPLLLNPVIQKSNQEYRKASMAEVQVDKIEKIITSPGFAGIQSWITSPLSKTVESAKDIVNLFGGTVGYEKQRTQAIAALDQGMQNALLTGDKDTIEREKAAYQETRGLLVNPAYFGTYEQMRNLLAISIGSNYLDRGTVLGFHTMRDDLFDFQKGEPVASALSRLQVMKNEIRQGKKNIEAEREVFKQFGIPMPQYDFRDYMGDVQVPGGPGRPEQTTAPGGNIEDLLRNLGGVQ